MRGIEAAAQGRLGGDPEFKLAKNGTLPLLTFSVAVDDGGADAPPIWLRVTAFKDVAEAMRERLTKGARVYCEGRLSLDRFTDKNGAERQTLKLTANVIQPLGQIGQRRPAQPKKRQEQNDSPSAPPAGHADPNDPLPW